MKKLLVSIIVLVIVIMFNPSVANAESGEKQFIVIKNGNNVIVYTITDRGKNMYGNKDATIDVNNFVNPAVRDLRAYDVPEEAWKMCSMSENGAYDSRVTKIGQNLTEVKANYDNETENTRFLEEKIGWLTVYFTILVLGIIAITIIMIIQSNKIKKLKQK